MSLRLRTGHRVFVYSQYVDLRAGFNKLSMFVRERMSAKLVDGDLFLFMGKNRKKIKAICFDGTGLLVIAKRLDSGCFMKLEKLESLEITADELDALLRGSVIKRTYFGQEALTHYNKSRMNMSDDSSALGEQSRDHQAVCNLP
jgi:transposase